MSPLVSAKWLALNKQDSKLKIVDATWHLPTAGRNAKAEFQQNHIPAAVYFDIDACSTPGALPHMLPSKAQFIEYVEALHIRSDDHVVVYDTYGIFSAARVWWMFRHFGFERVSVLNGGIAAWNQQSADAPTRSSAEMSSGRFAVANVSQVLKASEQQDTQILDARPSSRFHAEEKEFRPGLRSGHIPNSINLPFAELLNDGFMKPANELIALFNEKGIQTHLPIVTTCGSGVTAAIINLAFEVVGATGERGLYDGSWTEWGADQSLPIAP